MSKGWPATTKHTPPIPPAIKSFTGLTFRPILVPESQTAVIRKVKIYCGSANRLIRSECTLIVTNVVLLITHSAHLVWLHTNNGLLYYKGVSYIIPITMGYRVMRKFPWCHINVGQGHGDSTQKCHDLMPLQFGLRLRLHKNKWGARTMATAASMEVKVKVSLSWDKLTDNPWPHNISQTN